jgi:hypothetical protein
MTQIAFDPPRSARIREAKHQLFAGTLANLGLHSQEFRAIGQEGNRIIVHPDDVSAAAPRPFGVREDIVEFTDDES